MSSPGKLQSFSLSRLEFIYCPWCSRRKAGQLLLLPPKRTCNQESGSPRGTEIRLPAGRTSIGLGRQVQRLRRLQTPIWRQTGADDDDDDDTHTHTSRLSLATLGDTSRFERKVASFCRNCCLQGQVAETGKVSAAPAAAGASAAPYTALATKTTTSKTEIESQTWTQTSTYLETQH